MGWVPAFLERTAAAWLDWMIPMSWQVALLVGILFGVALLARKASPRFRYFLWCLVLAKLCLPPGIAFFTGIGHWLPFPNSTVVTESITDIRENACSP